MQILIDGEYKRLDLIQGQIGILFSPETLRVVGFLSLYCCRIVLISVSN